MQPIRRLYEHRSRTVRRLFQLWYSNQSIWLILILWAISYCRSLVAYQQLAQELRPDNPLCSSSSTCVHIQIPLHLALFGQILSLYMLRLIIITIFWPLDCVGADILMSEEVLNDWYRWNSLMVAVSSFPVLALMEQYDNVGPWISLVYAVFRATLFMAYFVLAVRWYNTIVQEAYAVQPDQEPQWLEDYLASDPQPSESNNSNSKPDKSDIPKDQSHAA